MRSNARESVGGRNPDTLSVVSVITAGLDNRLSGQMEASSLGGPLFFLYTTSYIYLELTGAPALPLILLFHPQGTRVYTFSEEADATPHEQSRRDHTASVPLKQREACTYTGPNSMLFGCVLLVPRKLYSHKMNCFIFFFFILGLKIWK